MTTELKQWHYNFRNKAQLPDLKTLQREFSLSLMSIGLAALLVCSYAVIALYGLGLHLKIKNLDSQAILKAQASQSSIQKNSLFKAYQALSEDLKTLYYPAVDPVKSLYFLSQAVPSDLIFQFISFKENEKIGEKGLERSYDLALDGFIQGNEEKALVLIESFKKHLMDIDFFQKNLKDLKVDSLKRDSQYPNILNVSIKLQLIPS